MVNFAKRRYIRPNYTSHKIFPAGTSKQKVFRIISSGAMRKEEGGKRERLAILSWFDPLRLRRKEKESGKKKKKKKSGHDTQWKREKRNKYRSRVRRRERTRIVPIRWYGGTKRTAQYFNMLKLSNVSSPYLILFKQKFPILCFSQR